MTLIQRNKNSKYSSKIAYLKKKKTLSRVILLQLYQVNIIVKKKYLIFINNLTNENSSIKMKYVE